MEEQSAKSYTEANRKSITGDASADNAFWRLSLILREIAESVTTKEPIESDKSKPPSGRRRRKALELKKEGNDDDNVA